MMDCERSECGHPLALHDPCSVRDCACPSYEPADRKERVALLTDKERPMRKPLATIRRAERARSLT